MSKKAKTEVDEKSAVIITDAVLAENQAKLDSYEKSIKAVQERRRKVIIDSKLYTYDKLSQLYGGAEGLWSRAWTTRHFRLFSDIPLLRSRLTGTLTFSTVRSMKKRV